MKRMIPCILIATAGLTVCGWLVLRHSARTAGKAPAGTRKALPVDSWQSGIRVDTRTEYTPDAAGKRMEEKLRQEERRQKPWEGRN